MRLALAVLLLALTVLPHAARAGAEGMEVDLEWEPGLAGSTTTMFVPFREEPIEGITPPADVKDARFARIRWGVGPGLAVALDVDPSSTRIWLDTNLDGSLADETRFAWDRSGDAWSRTDSVAVRYEDEMEVIPVRLYHHASWDPTRVQILPMAHRLGEAVLGGRVRTVALSDRNSDLRFDDADRDALYIDLDGDGAFRGSFEQVQPGVPFRVRDEGWTVRVLEPSGRRLRFERTDTPPERELRPWPRVGVPTAGIKPSPPSESYEAVLERLQAESDEPYAQRYGTIGVIGRFGTPEAFDLLYRMADRETDANVRAAAVRAMGNAAYLKHGGARLVELTDHAVPGVAGAALQALHGMGHPDRSAVYERRIAKANATIASQAVRYLAYLDGDEVRSRVESVFREGRLPAVRLAAYQGMRTWEEGPPIDVVLAAARDDYVSLRAQGLRDLKALDHPAAGRAALEASRDRPLSDIVAGAAAEVLGALADAESVEALLAMLPDVSPRMETTVAQQLTGIRDAGAIEVLMAALGHRDARIRAVAAEALAGARAPRVTAALLKRAKREKDELVLGHLLEALGDHGDPEAIDLLLKQARRRRDTVRLLAIRALARVGLANAKVRDFFEGLLLSRHWEDRVLALDAARHTEDPELCPRVQQNLGHDERAVRLAAAEALGVLRCGSSIEPLIARLDVEEEPRIRDAVAHALFLTTGMYLYDDAETWRRWWEEHRGGFEVPEEVPTAPETDAGGTTAGFYGIPVRSSRSIFVIDQSGSMSVEDPRPAVTGEEPAASGNRLDVAVREVVKATEALRSRDRVNVIFFHTTVHPWKDAMQPLSSANRSALKRHLLAQRPTGGTNLYDGLELALLDPDVDTVFVLSDGAPGAGRFVATDDILRAVRRLNQVRRIAIHCVSIGRDSDLMRRLAEENGGRYVRR